MTDFIFTGKVDKFEEALHGASYDVLTTVMAGTHRQLPRGGAPTVRQAQNSTRRSYLRAGTTRQRQVGSLKGTCQ